LDIVTPEKKKNFREPFMTDILDHINHHLMDTYMKCKEHVSFLQS